jgi:IS5 family transposase
MAFLDFPDPFPDSMIIWLFEERMSKTEKDKLVRAELLRQLDAMGSELSVERSRMQPSSKPTLDR